MPLFELAPTKGATISDCGRYRYHLWRQWTRREQPNTVLFGMLNPSKADAMVDDPTVRRSIRIAKRHEFDRLEIVNMFALRATNPKELVIAEDPIGPLNQRHINEAAHKASCIVIACGASVPRGFRSYVRQTINRLHEDYELWCFGLTNDGWPRHPLFVKSDVELEEYKPTRRRA